MSDLLSAPDVSVIMPAWNCADTIEEAIQSALGQTGCTLEIVVADDGSTDATPGILTRFDDRVRWKSFPNGGPAAARNRAAAMARGRWLAFLDSDDLWDAGKLQLQLAAAEETGATVVYTNARNFGDNLPVDELRLRDDQCHAGDVFERLLEDNFVTLSGLMVRRDVFEAAGGFEESIVGTEDWDLLLRLAATESFAVVREPLTHYRWVSASLSKRHDVMLKAKQETIRRALESERGRTLPGRVRRTAQAGIWNSSAFFAEASDRWRSVWWYLRSLAWQPWQPSACRGIARALLKR